MAFLTADQIRSNAIQFIDNRGSGIRTEAGEPVVDLVDAFAQEAAALNIISQYNIAINSIAGWQSIVDDATFKTELAVALGVSSITLDTDLARRLGVPEDIPSDIEAIIYHDLSLFAASVGRPRRGATFANGPLRLYLASNSPFTLLRGASVRTGGTSSVIYDTNNDLVGVSPALDPVRNQYFVDTTIVCRLPGQVGNQIANTVNAMLSPITGVASVTNTAAVESGFEAETNDQLLTALVGVQAGPGVGLEQGLKNFVVGTGLVQDVLVVGPGDPLMQRATSGSVDVYIIGSQLVTETAVYQIAGEGQTVTIFHQPVRSVNSVIDTTTSVPLSEGGGYLVIPDPGLLAGSAQARTQVQFAFPPVGPAVSDLVSVNFTYNSLVRDLQRTFENDPAKRLYGTSVLFREALKVLVFFEMQVVNLPGFTASQAQDVVELAIQNYLNGFLLGQELDFSVIIGVAQNAQINGSPAVERIDGFIMGLTAQSLSTDDLIITETEYFRLADINFISP